MTSATTASWEDESVALARALFAFLQSIDPSRWRSELEEAARVRLQELSAQAMSAAESIASSEEMARAEAQLASLQTQLATLASLLDSAPAHTPDESYEAQWEAFRKRLAVGYEELASTLKRHAVQVPTLRPTNHTRSLVHVAMGMGAMLLVEHVLTERTMPWVAGAAALTAWSMEISRHLSPRVNAVMMAVLGKIAHAHERHRVNSSTWYTTALFILALTMRPMMCAIAIAVLACADPFAALVGRRFGTLKIVGNRSLQGTLAFAAMGLFVGFAVLRVYHPAVGVGASLAVASGAAVAGAVAELFSVKLDDNLTIPVSTAAGGTLVAALIGLG